MQSEKALELAQERLTYSERLHKRGFISLQDLNNDQRQVDLAKRRLKLAQTLLEAFDKSTDLQVDSEEVNEETDSSEPEDQNENGSSQEEQSDK